ncbi:MAG TPA: AMP-binding protein, partial [Thermomicrobiales bacterium]|nr:AMP-binding protein [Thermomicrobiales bacterium]
MSDEASSPGNTDRVAWSPDERSLARSRLMRLISETGSGSYTGLLERIAQDPEWYWLRILEDLDLVWHRPFDRVWDLARGKAWPEWFPGAGFNYVSSALDRHTAGAGAGRTAVIWEGDAEEVRALTFAELDSMTNAVARALLELGIQRGDRIGIYLPMLPETVAVTLACSKVGAVFVPLFSGFGEEAIVSRLQDCDARVLITADGFWRRGREVALKDVADRAMARLPGIEHCLVIPHTGRSCAWDDARDRRWQDLVHDGGAPVET